MTKEKLQEEISKVVCAKPDNITCEECFKMAKGQICRGYKQCRISEKTEEQLEYVLSSIQENVFLKACAGSGKTEVVGLKTAYEIKKWKECNSGIAVLSFTNDSTEVIKDRVSRFVGKQGGYPHYIGTLSSFIHNYIVQPFAYKTVKYQGKNKDFSLRVIDERMSIYSNHWAKNYKCNISFVNSKKSLIPIYSHQVGFDLVKRDYYFYFGYKRIWLEDYFKSESVKNYITLKRKENPHFWEWNDVRKCFRECKEEFWKHGFANFDDLNILAVRILKSSIGQEIAKRFPLILIDECQDLSGNELKVLHELKEKGCHIHFIGDLNQSIYEFKQVDQSKIEEFVCDFQKYALRTNFRSCKEIVCLSKKLLEQPENIEWCSKNNRYNNALVYIEYVEPEEAVKKYVELLENIGCTECDNKILVKQNVLRKQLEESVRNDFDAKEPLIVAVQLWKEKRPLQMKVALELAGLQISKWFGGSRTVKNYHCPQEIDCVFAWRIYLMEVLNEIERSKILMNFTLTFAEWHQKAKQELNRILYSCYDTIKKYDDNRERDFTKLVNGYNFKVGKDNKDMKICDLERKFITDTPILTIHGSKGCTYDTTLIISSENAKSEGGHWKSHWINGYGEEKRIGYVASTRAKYLLVWGVPTLNKQDKKILENYGFVSIDSLNYS